MEQPHPTPQTYETFATVKAFYLSSAAWMVIGTLMGFIDATHLAAPDLIKNVSWLVFGRSRPMHTNIVIFGFAGSSLLGSSIYIVSALSRAPLHSETLGKWSVFLWNLSVAAGTVLLALGFSQGREYAEWIWPVDLGVLGSLAMILVNCLLTVRKREEKILYVSNWYILASLTFIFLIYFFGNAVWNPRHGALHGGISDSILAWFYGHGLVGLFLTPLAIAVSYYAIPILCRTPLYSHTLSMAGFWTILVVYTHIGAHHLLQAPLPTWLKVVAITGSMGMLVPVLIVLLNLWLTMRGRLAVLHSDIGGKFIFAGLVWYLLTCLQGPYQALPSVQRVTHLNNWVVAHSHMGVLGFAATIGLGGMYFILPRITRRPLYSTRLADLQFWLVLLGMSGFFLVLTAAGLIQGNGWLNGETVYRILPEIHVYMVYRAGIGIFIISGALIGLYNVYRSIYSTRSSESAQ